MLQPTVWPPFSQRSSELYSFRSGDWSSILWMIDINTGYHNRIAHEILIFVRDLCVLSTFWHEVAPNVSVWHCVERNEPRLEKYAYLSLNASCLGRHGRIAQPAMCRMHILLDIVECCPKFHYFDVKVHIASLKFGRLCALWFCNVFVFSVLGNLGAHSLRQMQGAMCTVELIPRECAFLHSRNLSLSG